MAPRVAAVPNGPSSAGGEAEALLARLAVHDPAAELHCRRVATWCSRIAAAMQHSPAEITFAAQCGLLHDIGKLFTPSSTLRKSGPLTPRQWSQMQDHVGNGASVLGDVPVLMHAADVVAAHHERFDGGGYPRGLAGEQIPLEARVVAVADTLDAMISGRLYREPIRPVQALAEIQRCSGSQLDPLVVDALVCTIKGKPRADSQEKDV